jgi:hypothetical protein
MRVAVRVTIVALISMLAAVAQTAKAAHPATPWKSYCQPDGGFCFKYPSSWRMMGDIYGGNGVMVAPAQRDQQPVSDEITVAMVAPPKDAGEALGLDGIIQQAADGMREAGQNFQTLQRAQRTVDAKLAEMLKAQYREKTTGRDWIEELVFIEGPDNEIYSVALKTVPQNMPKLEPVFTEVVRTWRLPEPEAPPDDEATPAPAAPSNKTPATTQPH